MPFPVRALVAVGALVAVTAACSSTSSGDAVAITANDTECIVAKTSLDAGNQTFEVKNDGSQVTEVYVYAPGDRVVTEKENIGPGTSATFSADLAAGNYEIACKPGQTGSGIRQPITVTGSGGGGAKPADREVHISGKDFSFAGLEGFQGRVNETVKFEMKNDGAVEHEFEVFLPDGQALGEIGPTFPGKEADVTLTFPVAGTYTFVCDIEGHKAAGMEGSFTVV